MSFSSLKKQLARSNQFLAEKLAGAKATDKGIEYKQVSQLIDHYKRYYENIQKRVVCIMEPDINGRTRARATAVVSKLQGSNKNEQYPHAEGDLASCCTEFSRLLSQQPDFSAALARMGEAYSQLCEAKNQALEETKSGFLQPINETLNQDIKQITYYRKRAESKRLTYDAKKHSLDKAHLPPDLSFNEAEHQFEEALSTSFHAMNNFLEGEAEQIEALNNLISAQLSYHQDATRILTDLQRDIQARLQDAREHARQRPTDTHNGKPGFWEPSSLQPSPVQPSVQMKPKYDTQLQQTPTCQALYDFEAENPFELSFHEGDILKLIDQIDENWFLGEFNGKEGHFPTNYVRVLVPLS